MKKQSLIYKAIALCTALALSSSSSAVSLQEIFDGVNTYSNVSGPSAIQGQTMGYYNGGSLFMRTPKKTYQLAAMTAPSWSSGCGGIDLFAGSFSFINKEQFVALLRNVGQNSLGYAFKLAIQNLCPTCDNVMQALEATARAMNNLNVNSCQMAEGLVNASVPDTWKKSESNLASTYGNATNQFGDAFDAWSSVYKNRDTAKSTLDNATSQDATLKDKVPEGNITWKALQKLPGLDDATRELYMSMIGTVIFDSTKGQPQFIPATDIDIKTLIGDPGQTNVSIPTYTCGSDSNCMAPTSSTVTSFTSLSTLVEQKLSLLASSIGGRQAYGSNLNDIIQFVNVTDIPVYKLVAVTTSLNNSGMAESLISKYKELIAAKYAQVFVDRVAKDLRAALTQLSATADSSQNDAIKTLQDRLDQLEKKARDEVALAHTQTISTYAITQEIQTMERAMNSSLSPMLQNAIAFQKGMGH